LANQVMMQKGSLENSKVSSAEELIKLLESWFFLFRVFLFVLFLILNSIEHYRQSNKIVLF
jgi:hypothetical protein